MKEYIVRFKETLDDSLVQEMKFHAEDQIHAINQLMNYYNSIDGNDVLCVKSVKEIKMASYSKYDNGEEYVYVGPYSFPIINGKVTLDPSQAKGAYYIDRVEKTGEDHCGRLKEAFKEARGYYDAHISRQ